jgi:DNA-binding NtrC family response regulator
VPALRWQFKMLERIAGANVPVLIRGETGTGKELIARTVHERSGRRGALVGVNCGALPRSLIESELFGCRKGAFTGATEDRAGLVRAAEGGTLFLDEIAELAESSQVALLRTLQESEVLPVGGNRTIRVDVRVIAATHQDLAARVQQGKFRQDLYARLAGFQIELPALRERREDLGLLIGHILRRAAGKRAGSIRFHRAAARALFLHHWPLNVRELEHALTSALALAGGDGIAADHLPVLTRERLDQVHEARALDGPTQRAELIRLFTKHRGNLSAVARELGKARMQIRRLIRRYDIDLGSFRGAGARGDSAV